MNANPTEKMGPQDEAYISKQELGRRLKKPRRTIDYWMWRGWIPYYKIGRAVLFKWSEVEQKLGRKYHHD